LTSAHIPRWRGGAIMVVVATNRVVVGTTRVEAPPVSGWNQGG